MDSQKRRLLGRLATGPVLQSRSDIGRWLGRRAGAVIKELELVGVIVSVKVGRRLYLAAVWRWKP